MSLILESSWILTKTDEMKWRVYLFIAFHTTKWKPNAYFHEQNITLQGQ